MHRQKPIRPIVSFLSAWTLAAVVAFGSLPAAAQSDQDRWQAEMDPASHAHMLGNTAEAEDHYLEALKLAERFDRSGSYLERSMAGLGGLYAAEGRFAEAVSLYRQALTIAEALYDQGDARLDIYRAALAAAEAGNTRQEAATIRAQEAAAKRYTRPAPTRPLAETAAPAPRDRPLADKGTLPASPPVPAAGTAQGDLQEQLAATPLSDPPLPAARASVLTHYRLAGAVVPPPPPAEVLSPPLPVSAPPAAMPAVARAMPAAMGSVPLRGTPVPRAPASKAPAALPPAVDAVEVAAGDPAAEVAPQAVAARLANAEGPPLRGTPPPFARPPTVAPEDVATVSRLPAADNGTAPVVAETAPAEAKSWESRPVEIAGRPVDATVLRALAADPAAPPEVAVRAVPEETPAEIARRAALVARHPVLGVRLGAATRNMGPIYPDTPRLADTEQAYLAQLQALERSLGPDHPDVAVMMYKLARLYHRQSRYEPAGKMYERCLAVREKILPEGHPDRIETLVNYARLLRASGFPDLAAELRTRAKAQRAAAN